MKEDHRQPTTHNLRRELSDSIFSLTGILQETSLNYMRTPTFSSMAVKPHTLPYIELIVVLKNTTYNVSSYLYPAGYFCL